MKPPPPPSSRRAHKHEHPGFVHLTCDDPGCPFCSTLPETPTARRSVPTLFKFKARQWWAAGVLLFCLGLLAYAIALTLIR